MVSERETLPVNGFRKRDLTSKWFQKEETLPVNGFRKRYVTSKWFQKEISYQ